MTRPYITIAEVQSKIPNDDIAALTDDVNGSVIDATKVTDAIERAEDRIDAYLRGRFEVPLDPVPPIIKRIATSLAVFELYSRKLTILIPETVETLKKEADMDLKRIQNGDIVFDAGKGTAPAQYEVRTTLGSRTFTKADLDSF